MRLVGILAGIVTACGTVAGASAAADEDPLMLEGAAVVLVEAVNVIASESSTRPSVCIDARLRPESGLSYPGSDLPLSVISLIRQELQGRASIHQMSTCRTNSEGAVYTDKGEQAWRIRYDDVRAYLAWEFHFREMPAPSFFARASFSENYQSPTSDWPWLESLTLPNGSLRFDGVVAVKYSNTAYNYYFDLTGGIGEVKIIGRIRNRVMN